MNLIKMIVKNYAYKPSKNIEGTVTTKIIFYVLRIILLAILNSYSFINVLIIIEICMVLPLYWELLF